MMAVTVAIKYADRDSRALTSPPFHDALHVGAGRRPTVRTTGRGAQRAENEFKCPEERALTHRMVWKSASQGYRVWLTRCATPPCAKPGGPRDYRPEPALSDPKGARIALGCGVTPVRLVCYPP